MASSKKQTDPVVEEITSTPADQVQPDAAPIATLLSSISYTNQADYDNFLNNLTPEHSVIVLISAANHCQSKGIFTLDEAELIAKSIKTLSVQPETTEATKP